MIPLTINCIGEIMPLNLGHLTSDVVDDVDHDQFMIFLLNFENKVNNICNALEIAEKAKATGSAEVMSFAHDLLGVSCEDLVKGLGYKHEKTEADLANDKRELVMKFPSVLDNAAKKFREMKNKNSNAEVTITMLRVPDNMGGNSKDYAPYNGKTLRCTVRQACAICENVCRQFSNMFKAARNQIKPGSPFNEPSHKKWRKYQLLGGFVKRLIMNLDQNALTIERAVDSRKASTSVRSASRPKPKKVATKGKKSDDFNW